jgi:hypothetical protein
MVDKRYKFCKCGEKSKYSPKYDLFGCSQCMIWTEGQRDCGDKSCYFCPRPDKPPSETVWEVVWK